VLATTEEIETSGMSTDKSDQEPSMEEILSSIRRIIADDEDESASAKPAAAAPTKPAPPAASIVPGDEDDDVLDLTQVVEDGKAQGKDDHLAGGDGFDSEVDELELEPDDEAGVPLAPPPPQRGRAKPTRAAAAPMLDDEDSLVSAVTADRSTGALAKLTRAAASREPAALAHGEKTVEIFLLEMLRPMLKEWLDANLEGVVERVVEQEVKKLARRAELM
jgi:cell pole-organizing protein PopZ